jgi:hypothetical protein
MSATQSIKVKLRKLLRRRHVVKPGLEAVYQKIFQRDLKRIGIEDVFYPLGFAANYGLLYFILRSAKSFHFKSIVELGAGQTSLLLNSLVEKHAISAAILSVEHNKEWADRVRAQVRHSVMHANLAPGASASGRFVGYDFSSAKVPALIDFLIVDGPPGASIGGKFARHGALALIDRLDPRGFVVVVDDAERPGEIALGDLICKELRAKKIDHNVGEIVASKRQIIISSGEFWEAAYF